MLSACSALALAGCGGESDERAAPAPTLPAALAERLAADADAVAARLDASDPCEAARRAAALQQRTIAALNRPGMVPAELKEDLGAAVADVVDRAQSECAAAQPAPASPPPAALPPAQAPTIVENAEEIEEDDRGDPEGRGKGKGKDKEKRGKGRGKKDD